MTKNKALNEQFAKAVDAFGKVLRGEGIEGKFPADYLRDSAIQRFEFTFDLGWKLAKQVLYEKFGVSCASPKKCLEDAFQQKLIDNDVFWAKLCDFRNITTHTYDEKKINKIYKALPKAHEEFLKLLDKIKN